MELTQLFLFAMEKYLHNNDYIFKLLTTEYQCAIMHPLNLMELFYDQHRVYIHICV